MKDLRVAVVQMISTPSVAENLASAARLLAEAAARGAQLAVLPEYFPVIGGSDAARLALAETPGQGPIQDFLADTARRLGLWLVGGSMPLVASVPHKLRNATLVFDAMGNRVARYDKIHLFGFRQGDESYDEAATIEAGSTPVAFDTPWGRVGLAICYDLRFPELFRALAVDGAPDLLVVPAAFTETTGRAHWELLLRARAVENQCYVLAAAQGGRHPEGRITHGNSMIVDPWGDIVARLDKGEGVAVADLTASRLTEIRSRLPALQHRILKSTP